MKKGYTHIAILFDSSGSMARIKIDMEEGLKYFLDQQKLIPGELTISLATFSNFYKPIFTRKSINEIDKIEIIPNGSTALIDSTCLMIQNVGKDLDSLPEEEKPEKIIFIIITDGEENSSKEYNNDQLKEMITHQESIYNWNFVFIGANQDSFSNARSMGVSTSSVINYHGNEKSINLMYNSISNATLRYRSASSDKFSFTQEEQDIVNESK